MKIADLYQKKTFVFSIEIFPPKNPESLERLKLRLEEFKSYHPDFISVTYGAGGSTRENTHELASFIQNDLGIETMAHLTCVSHTRQEIEEVLEQFHQSGIENLILRWGRFQEMSVGLDRAFEVLDLEPEVADAEDAIELKDIDPRVVFENVSFSYQPDQPTLQDINLTAMPGAVTAIVGPTGSGKSTLMMLLLRLFDPDEGIVRVGGRNIQEFTVNSLRANVAIALQENILFSTSIKENIRYAVSDATDEEVYEAARITDAEGFILDQKFGYNTELGERGARLSTGQRQRLSIARAVLKNTPILILDEPTAALDAVTESRVMHNLSQWGSNRVIFLITHRLSTIRQADQIIYVRNGRITEVGSHEALLKKEGGGYRRFVELEESLMTANIE